MHAVLSVVDVTVCSAAGVLKGGGTRPLIGREGKKGKGGEGYVLGGQGRLGLRKNMGRLVRTVQDVATAPVACSGGLVGWRAGPGCSNQRPQWSAVVPEVVRRPPYSVLRSYLA